MTEKETANDLYVTTPKERRRNLLPVWIKIFLWIFVLFGFLGPVGLAFGLLGKDFDLSLYGIETIKPLSVIGVTLISLFALKGLVSFGLWTEKSWAVTLAITDAALGIILCMSVMILPLVVENTGLDFTVRLELIALIPYLNKMINIKEDWKNSIAKG